MEENCEGADAEFANRCEQQLDPVDYWAVGRPDWAPLGGMTGTRPVVDRYTVTRFSTNEWEKRNQDLIATADKLVKETVR